MNQQQQQQNQAPPPLHLHHQLLNGQTNLHPINTSITLPSIPSSVPSSAHQHPQQQPQLPNDTSKFKKSGGLRVRVRKACDRCKRQKIKCDGESPCKVCHKNDHECLYSIASPASSGAIANGVVTGVRELKDREERASGDGYTRYLENRIFELESKLEKALQKQDINTEQVFHDNSYTFSGDKYRVMRRYQNIIPLKFGEELSKSIDLFEINQGRPDDEKVVIPRIQFYGWNLSGGHYLKQRKLPELISLFKLQDSKEVAVVNWLLNYFFVKINPLHSIIHKRVFYDQYNSYLNNLSKKDESTRLFTAMLYLVLSIAIRFSTSVMPSEIKSRIAGDLEEQLFDSAYEVTSKLSFEWQSYELIQCWVLVTFYLRVTHRQNSSFMALGSAIRMMKGMSLNLNIIPERLQRYAYEEIKLKRIFWIVYTWDKIYSFQSGKSSEVADHQIFVPLPSLNEELTDDWINPLALSMTHLGVIASEVLKYNVTHTEYDSDFYKRIIDKLDQWKKSTDENIQTLETESKQADPELVSQLYLTYHDILLNIHNKTLMRHIQNLHNIPIASEAGLINHSNEVLNIIKSISNRNELVKPWWLTLTILFNVSLTSLLLINIAPQPHLSPILQNSLSFLKDLETQGQFGMVKECIWCLNTLNYLSVLKFENGMKLLRDASEIASQFGGIRNDVNKIKFYQFGKVDDNFSSSSREPSGENEERQQSVSNDSNVRGETVSGSNPGASQVSVTGGSGLGLQDFPPIVEGDLLGNLKWFDQWLNDFK